MAGANRDFRAEVFQAPSAMTARHPYRFCAWANASWPRSRRLYIRSSYLELPPSLPAVLLSYARRLSESGLFAERSHAAPPFGGF